MKFLFMMMIGVSFLFGSVDLNHASAKELSSLKGIGMVKANAIVAFRKGHCFKKIDELSLVSGIGKKTVEKNLKNLVVSGCKKH
jgi:competence protein ComEA